MHCQKLIACHIISLTLQQAEGMNRDGLSIIYHLSSIHHLITIVDLFNQVIVVTIVSVLAQDSLPRRANKALEPLKVMEKRTFWFVKFLMKGWQKLYLLETLSCISIIKGTWACPSIA